MTRFFWLFVAATLLSGSPVHAREFSGLSARGPSGLLLAPSAAMLRADRLGAGITGGVGKAAYGLFGAGEAGLRTPDLLANPKKDDWHRDLTVFLKGGGTPFPRVWGEPSIAAGVSTLVFSLTAQGFACATWTPSVLGWIIEGNAGWGSGDLLDQPFGGLGVIPPGLFNRAIKFIVEYAGEEGAAGARMALSRDLRLDAFVLMRAVPPGGSAGRQSWLIVASRGVPGASWSVQAGLPRLWRRSRRTAVPASRP